MTHAARQVPAWLIFDVGQKCESISMRMIGSDVAEAGTRRSDGAGTVSSAYVASRAAGQSCRRSCAVRLAAFGQSRSWLIRATHATQSDILPQKRFGCRFRSRPCLWRRGYHSCRGMMSRVCNARIAIGSRAAGFRSRFAQQGARANAGICHAACDFT